MHQQTLQLIISTAYTHLDKTQSSMESLATLEVLINAILYNAPAALQIMESTNPGSARVFFDRWFAAIRSEKQVLKRVHDKKLSILALCALLEMPPASVPESLQDGWASIVGGILQIFKDLPAAIQGWLIMSEGILMVLIVPSSYAQLVVKRKKWL
jgi:importin-7